MLASLLRIILLTATLKILERGLDKGPIIMLSKEYKENVMKCLKNMDTKELVNLLEEVGSTRVMYSLQFDVSTQSVYTFLATDKDKNITDEGNHVA